MGRLRPLQLLGGDRAVKEPIRVTMSLLAETFGALASDIEVPAMQSMTDQQRDVFLKMALRKINATPTTSMGRLFDGVSALLGICSHIEYEAQAAIEMEALLQRNHRMVQPFAYAIDQCDGYLELDYRPIISDLVRLLGSTGANLPELSRCFHSTVVDMIGNVCARLVERHGTDQIVMSGGVFGNEFVLVNALKNLELRGFKPYCHRLVPSNDGGISLGQVVVAAHATAPRTRLEKT